MWTANHSSRILCALTNRSWTASTNTLHCCGIRKCELTMWRELPTRCAYMIANEKTKYSTKTWQNRKSKSIRKRKSFHLSNSFCSLRHLLFTGSPSNLFKQHSKNKSETLRYKLKFLRIVSPPMRYEYMILYGAPHLRWCWVRVCVYVLHYYIYVWPGNRSFANWENILFRWRCVRASYECEHRFLYSSRECKQKSEFAINRDGRMGQRFCFERK